MNGCGHEFEEEENVHIDYLMEDNVLFYETSHPKRMRNIFIRAES